MSELDHIFANNSIVLIFTNEFEFFSIKSKFQSFHEVSRVPVTNTMEVFLILVICCLGAQGLRGQRDNNEYFSNLLKQRYSNLWLKGCSINNGGCEHVCISTEPQVCRCRKGYVINDDGRTCSGRSHIRARFVYQP